MIFPSDSLKVNKETQWGKNPPARREMSHIGAQSWAWRNKDQQGDADLAGTDSRSLTKAVVGGQQEMWELLLHSSAKG